MTTTATASLRQTLGLRHEPIRFVSLALASSCAARSKCDVVMLGDDGRFWIVCLADAQRLERLGFEWAL
jgi:hypothetical protein